MPNCKTTKKTRSGGNCWFSIAASIALSIHTLLLPSLAAAQEQREPILRRSANSQWSIGTLGRPGNTEKIVPQIDFNPDAKTKKVVPSECDALARLMLDAEALGTTAPTPEFVARCLQDWSPRLSAPMTPLDTDLALILGLLVDKAGRPFCMGFRVLNDVVATARHCFFDRTTGVPINSFQDVSFKFVKDSQSYAVSKSDCAGAGICNQVLDGTPFSTSKDILLLQVPQLAPLAIPQIVLIDDIKIGEKVLLIGMSFEFGASQHLMSDGNPNGCTVAVKDKTCFYHGCSAGLGFSGAPVLRPTLSGDSKLEIVGIHLEGVGTSGSECKAPSLRDYGNVALIVSEKNRKSTP